MVAADRFDICRRIFRHCSVLKESQYEIVFLTYDLHQEESCEDNIVTEYERNFLNLGKKICKVKCILKKNANL